MLKFQKLVSLAPFIRKFRVANLKRKLNSIVNPIKFALNSSEMLGSFIELTWNCGLKLVRNGIYDLLPLKLRPWWHIKIRVEKMYQITWIRALEITDLDYMYVLLEIFWKISIYLTKHFFISCMTLNIKSLCLKFFLRLKIRMIFLPFRLKVVPSIWKLRAELHMWSPFSI